MADFDKLNVYGDLDVKGNDIKQVDKINDKEVDNLAEQTGDYSGLRARATTKADVGLSNVDNLSASSIRSGTTKSDVGLSNVDNYSRSHYDGRYVRTDSTNQSIAGTKTFSGTVNIDRLFMTDMGSNASRVGMILQRNSAEFGVHMSNSRLHIEPLGDQGDGLVMDGDGSVEFGGTISGNGSGLTNLNASNLSSGTVSTSRLPSSALVGDTTYSAGTGLSLSGTTFNVSNPFNPSGSYSGLRAQSTTKGDVGLGNVDNKSSSTIRSELTSSNVTGALGYTPVDRSGDTMSNKLTISNSNYRAHLDLTRGSNTAQINPSTGSNSGVSPELRFEGDMNGYWFDGRVKAEDGFYGDGSNLENLPVQQVSSSTPSNGAEIWYKEV